MKILSKSIFLLKIKPVKIENIKKLNIETLSPEIKIVKETIQKIKVIDQKLT